MEIQLRNLSRRLAERKMVLELSDRAKQILAKEGFDPVYGARPLKRAIQRSIQDPLALKVLGGEFSEGDVIEVDAGPADQLIFSKKAARAKGKVMPAHA